jgi:hypothetical protein
MVEAEVFVEWNPPSKSDYFCDVIVDDAVELNRMIGYDIVQVF